MAKLCILYQLALCLYQVQSLRIPNAELRQHTDLSIDSEDLSQEVNDGEKEESEVVADAADTEEARLDELAIQTFVPSAQLISQWLSTEKKHGVDFGHLQQSLPENCKSEVMGKKFKKKECADPWIQTKKCENAFEIPGYRLGDEFYQFLSLRNTADFAKFYFPNSIGDLYWRRHHKKSDYDTMNKVVDDPEYKDFERPDEKTLVIHVRGYDILTQSLVKEVNKGMYQQGNAYYKKVAEHAFKLNFTSATIVTGDHYVTQRAALTGKNTSAGEAIRATDRKINAIKEIFTEKGFTTVNVRRNMNADCDFVYMVNAKAFVPSGGGFDSLAATLVKKRGGTVMRK